MLAFLSDWGLPVLLRYSGKAGCGRQGSIFMGWASSIRGFSCCAFDRFRPCHGVSDKHEFS